jgi:hypothetical protein
MKGGSITVPLTGLESAVCFHLQNRLFQASQTGGHWYSDTSHLVFPDGRVVYRVRSTFAARRSDPTGRF